MLRSLIRWAVDNVLVVSIITIVLIAVGVQAFFGINVEAYPDPAPAIIEVIAQNPGVSAEEMERQVTIPLEVALAGMPRLKYTRSKSLFGLSHIRNQFEYGMDYGRAQTEVLNRLSMIQLPGGVKPELSPMSPIGELYRYTIANPKDASGHEVYALHDLKSLEDWTLEREFRRIPRIASVVSFGGQEKRYEIQPDPDRLKQYDITLKQLEEAISSANANAGGDYLLQPHVVKAVRGLGLLGNGRDPFTRIFTMHDPLEARDFLRAEEARRLREIRQIVLSATNNVPIFLGDVMDGGRQSEMTVAPPKNIAAQNLNPDPASDVTTVSSTPDVDADRTAFVPLGGYSQGTVIGHPTRSGIVSVARPKIDINGEELIEEKQRVWDEIDDTVQGVVLLRKGEQSLPALLDVKTKVKEFNQPGRMPPGMKLETFYDRTVLIDRTTETVHENLFLGMFLVSGILLVFLNHFRSAMIVAINIPLALMFALTMLYVRGQSANLLSLGAVDFGIIVDSSVIMVEAIYRKLSSGEEEELSLTQRIIHAANSVERPLFYSTLIMVCALLPLFLMTGPEGQIFAPMAETYAFSLGGALLLALVLSPVLCRVLMSKVKHSHDNFIVRGIKNLFLWQLALMLRFRWAVVGAFAALAVVTLFALQFLGREFMPALEEGNIYIRGTFPVSISLEEASNQTRTARHILQKYPEAAAILSQVGRPDDGTDPTGFYNSEIFVSLKSQEDWPHSEPVAGWRRMFFGKSRQRSKDELVNSMNAELDRAIVGVDWNFSQAIRDNVMETLSGVKGENSIKIIGPDLDDLEKKANEAAQVLNQIPGITNVGIFNITGQTNLEFAIDRDKCAAWNVSVAEVQDALQTAVGGKAFTQMVEGERTFDITLRFPYFLRSTEDQILDIPVEVMKNRVAPIGEKDAPQGFTLTGTNKPPPSVTGTTYEAPTSTVPRRRLRDLVTPINEFGEPDPNGKFLRDGASTIYREQGLRLIALKFSVRGRDLASAVAEAQEKTAFLNSGVYRTEWSGEFQQMQEAVRRLGFAVLLAMAMILVLLYLALRSVMDVIVVFANVLVICIGGIWSLLFTGLNFNISAGVGFISILGVGMMNGLILVSGFNSRRAQGIPVEEAIRDGLEKRIRPLTMTCLTAIFGMLPAAVATKIGSETQRPLAIVIVGGMTTTWLLLNLLPVLYSFYGHRVPPKLEGASMDH